MKHFIFILFSVLIFASCEKNELTSTEESSKPSLKNTNVFDPVLTQLQGIPVNIVLREGATTGNRFVSVHTSKRDVELNGCDDNTLHQRFLIIPYSLNSVDEEYYKIQVIGGLSRFIGDTFISLPHYDRSYSFVNRNYEGDAGSTEQTWFIRKANNSQYYHFGMKVLNKEKNTSSILYMTGQSNPIYGLRFEMLDQVNNGRQQWEIKPVESFQIVKMSYVLNSDDYIIHKPSFITSATVANNTSLKQTMSFAFQDKVTESSSYSKTYGVSTSVTAEAKVGIPLVAEGKLSTTSTSSLTWSYGQAQSKEDSRSYTFNIEAPSFTTITAKATVQMYEVSATYVVTLKGNTSGKEIQLTGKWKGVKAGEISYELIETKTGKLLRTVVGTPVQPVVL